MLRQNSTDWRSRIVVVAIVTVWFVLAVRLFFLQWADSEQYTQQARRQRSFVQIIPARPGEILDRQGRVLATSVTMQSLWINPSRVTQPKKIAANLASAVGLDATEFEKQLIKHRRAQFLWVRRRLDKAAIQRVRQLRLPEDVVNFRPEYLRRYPQGSLAAHVLGLRDVDGKGRGGIEQAFDSVLKGTSGQRTLIRDARGRVVEVRGKQTVPPQHGKTVVLTIDTVLQLFVEEEIDRLMKRWKPKTAAITVVYPKTGEVLAMASRPTFDPNTPENVVAAAWKNTNIASAYEPGSTFKPFIVGWALEKDRISREEVFHCSWGKYRMGRRLLHDHHPYGKLSVKNILIKSSNIGMAKIGERLKNPGLHRAATRFGFGRLTGSGLPGEIPGTVRSLKKWTSYSTGSVPMGQEISVTPLQMIMAHAALANGGTLMSPQFVLRISKPGTAVDRPLTKKRAGQRVVSRIVRPDIAHWIVREAMTGVVARGTARRARLKEYEVFGKTGTAQKTDPATGRYAKNRHVSSFVGGAPAANPRVLVLVVVDEPSVGSTHYGGTVAAPTAANIIRKSLSYLGIPTRTRTTAKTQPSTKN